MTSTPPGVSATPQSALNVVRQASGVSAGSAARVSLALNGATLGPDNADAELAAFGQTTLGAAGSVDALTQTTAANTAAIQALQAQAAADSNNGINVFVNFSTYADATSLAGFTENYSGAGTLGVSGGCAVLQPSGTGLFTADAIYSSTPTNTDYQLVSVIYATAPTGGGSNYIVGRSNAAGTTYVYAAIDFVGDILLYNVVSGTATEVASTGGTGAFYPGALYALECGINGSVTTYNVLVNGSSVLTWVDTSGVTNIGADYRYCGFGLLGATLGGVAQTASKVAAFGFVDNALGLLIGDICRAYSSASSAVATTSSTAAQLFPSGFFDSVALQSSNYTYDPATNKITVSVPGIYMVRLAALWTNGSAYSSYFGVAVYKNGVVHDMGNQSVLDSVVGSYVTAALPDYACAADTFIVQMDAGDYIQPGYSSLFSGYANQIIGDASDETVIFSCALINTGTAG